MICVLLSILALYTFKKSPLRTRDMFFARCVLGKICYWHDVVVKHYLSPSHGMSDNFTPLLAIFVVGHAVTTKKRNLAIYNWDSSDHYFAF